MVAAAFRDSADRPGDLVRGFLVVQKVVPSKRRHTFPARQQLPSRGLSRCSFRAFTTSVCTAADDLPVGGKSITPQPGVVEIEVVPTLFAVRQGGGRSRS